MLTPLQLYIVSVQYIYPGVDVKSVSISEFRANLLKYLNLVQKGDQFSITSKGRVMATLVSPRSQQKEARRKLDALARTAVIHDVISPLDADWEAMK